MEGTVFLLELSQKFKGGFSPSHSVGSDGAGRCVSFVCLVRLMLLSCPPHLQILPPDLTTTTTATTTSISSSTCLHP